MSLPGKEVTAIYNEWLTKPRSAVDLIEMGADAADAAAVGLVRQLLEGVGDLQSAANTRPSCQARVVARCLCFACAMGRASSARDAAKAWLVGKDNLQSPPVEPAERTM